MSTDKERMEIVLAHLRMNPSELAKSLGYARTQRIYFVLNERNGISESLARDINTMYPYISYQWLKNGTGDMLVDITPTEKQRIYVQRTNTDSSNRSSTHCWTITRS